MSDCCTIALGLELNEKKHRCPVNGQEYRQVSPKTVLLHIKKPWILSDTDQKYYFCEDPDCAVVYFCQDDSFIKVDALRTRVGIKEKNQDALVCYCFGVSIRDALENPGIKQFVLDQTKRKSCACEVRNPSGRCCLKDFKKLAAL